MAQSKEENEAVTMKAGFSVSEDGTKVKLEVMKIKCNNGEMHRLNIVDGHVEIVEHPKDEIEAEMVMARLGGRPCECVRFQLWERQNPRKK